MTQITSIREALKYADFDEDGNARCKGCGEQARFAEGAIESFFCFAARHRACTEVRKQLEEVENEKNWDIKIINSIISDPKQKMFRVKAPSYYQAMEMACRQAGRDSIIFIKQRG
jgi:hypothetical protein